MVADMFKECVYQSLCRPLLLSYECKRYIVQGGSNMTGTDLYVNKTHCAAAVRP